MLRETLCTPANVHEDEDEDEEEAEDIGMFTNPWDFPQGRATWPDVQSPEHGFVKLHSKRKLMRLRQTIYEDPGNPFADELESVDEEGIQQSDAGPLPPSPGARIDANEKDSTKEDEALRLLMEKSLSFGNHSNATVTRGQDVVPTSRIHHRSMSLAVPSTRRSEDTDEYVSPRRFWRQDSMPTAHLPQQHQDVAKQEARDTKFYGFYDDIMRDYKGNRL